MDDWMDERPLTFCPECSAEVDLTNASLSDGIVCTICGAEMIVLSLDPPEVDLRAME